MIAQTEFGLCRELSKSSLPTDLSTLSDDWQRAFSAIGFKGAHYPKSATLGVVCFYVRYAVSRRDLDELLADRGATVVHTTLNRWVVWLEPPIADPEVVPESRTVS